MADTLPGLFQRDPHSLLSEGAERSNVSAANEMLDGLFSRRDEMAKKSYSQLSSLYTNKEHYGRNTRLGMSAAEASKLVNKAFSGGRKD